MAIEKQYQQKIVHILTDIFPGVLIYYWGHDGHTESADSKQPEMDIALDVGRKIGDFDLSEAQRALAETDIPYTIYLYDLNAVADFERKTIIEKATAWKL